jgi:hypothetical protein
MVGDPKAKSPSPSITIIRVLANPARIAASLTREKGSFWVIIRDGFAVFKRNA